MTPQPDRGLPWVRIVVEGVVIVASVLLALAADAWWEGRTDAREAQAVLSDLRDELADSRDFMVGVLEATANEESGTREVVRLLDEAEGPVAVADSLVALLFQDITLNQPLGAYQSVVASGQIRLIEAQDLQNALASWASILDDVVEEQLRAQRLGDEQLRPLLENSVPDLSGAYSVLAEWESQKATTPVAESGMTLVRPSTQLSNLLHRRLYLLTIIQAEMDLAVEHLDFMIRLINREMAP